MCVKSNPAAVPAWLPATTDNCHQYFTQTVTAGARPDAAQEKSEFLGPDRS